MITLDAVHPLSHSSYSYDRLSELSDYDLAQELIDTAALMTSYLDSEDYSTAEQIEEKLHSLRDERRARRIGVPTRVLYGPGSPLYRPIFSEDD